MTIAFDPGCWCLGVSFDRTKPWDKGSKYVQHITIYMGPIMIMLYFNCVSKRRHP